MTVQNARADYSSTVLSYNPSAYWRLNETTPVPPADPATNSGTLGNPGNGYYLNGATHPTTGISGGGTDTAATIGNPLGKSQIRVPFQSALNQAGPFTAEFWAKPATVGATVCPYSSVDFGNARGWLFYQDLTVGQWSFRVYRNGANTTITAGTVTGGQWQHVVGVYDGANMSLYVNGTKVAGPTALPAAYTPVTNPTISLTMGIRSDANFAYNGDLDEMVLYTNALPDADVLAHYQAGINPATPNYSALIVTNYPPGYWRLGEPTYVVPTLPIANNLGYLGTSAQGTYQPGMTTGAAGPGYSGLGGATVGAFNAIAGYVNCGTSVPDLSAPLSRMTIMTWAKFSNVRSMDWEAMITCGDTAWLLQRINNDQSIGFRFGGTDLNTTGARPINDGKWHHIAATYDGAQQKIYIDGTLEIAANKTGSNAGEAAYPILIGENARQPGRIWNGNLAEMAVFTNALTASDVWTVYSSSWLAPTILSQAQASPTNYVFEGTAVTLSVTVGGAAPLAYQWSKNGTKISPATASSYLLTSSAVLADSATYSVVITNIYAPPVTSSVVLTVVGSPPFIVTQPASLTRFVGGQATFSVVVGGSLPRSFQWKKGGSPISGATASSYTIPNVQWSDAGGYSCTIANAYPPSTNTTTATLTVGGEFAAMGGLPDSGNRDRHTALGSDGTNLYFTLGRGPNAGFYKMPEGISGSWTTLAPMPLPATVNNDSGVGDMNYFGGALWTLARSPDNSQPRCVYNYNLAANAWTTGAGLPGDGPNAGIAVIATNHIVGCWIGANFVKVISDWQAGTVSDNLTLGNLAAHPWDSCIGPANVYIMRHNNTGAGVGVLATLNKTGTPVLTNIVGVPFNPGMGCAIEYMPGSLFANGHACLYVLSGGTGTGDGDGQTWTAATSVNQLAVYDLVTSTWDLQTLPFAVDGGSEMCLVNQTLYILGANSEAQPLKVLYMGPPVKPIVTAQPVSQTVYFGQSATFNVSVYGGGPYTYVWRRGGTSIPGATHNNLTFASADYTDAGTNYDVLISNSAGTTNSQLASLTVLPPPAFANLTNGLVIHLKFEGDYNDSSGNGNNATANGPPAFVPGKLGQAVELRTDTGSSIFNYLQVFDANTQFQFGPSDSFSIGFWLKYTNTFTDLPIIGNAHNSTYNPGYCLTEDNNQFEWTLHGVDTGAVDADPVGGPTLNDGAWHQLTVVFDRSQGLAKSFVDGAAIDTRSIAGVGTLITGNPLTIGSDDTGIYPVSGIFDLDDVGVWARALAPTEAEAIYMVGQKGLSYDTIAPITIATRLSGNTLQIIWQAGTLQWTEDLSNPASWAPVPGATPPYYYYTVTPGVAKKFFRVR